MKKYDQIHETVLKTIFDIYDDLDSLTAGGLEEFISKHKGKKTIRSIARSSNDLICVFPVLASRNIAIENQAMVCKAIEKNCVAMLQMLFSAVQLSDAKDAFDYINTFHTNINKSSKIADLDDIIRLSDALGITESALQVGGKVDNAIVEQVKADMKNLNFFFEDNVNPTSLEETFTCNLDPNGQYIVEVKTNNRKKGSANPTIPMEPTGNDLGAAFMRTHDQLIASQAREAYKDNIINQQKDVIGRQQDKNDRYVQTIADFKSQLADKDREVNDKLAKMRSGKDKTENIKNATQAFASQVLNSEYKKANELMPTLMVVNFKSKNGDNYELVDSVVIGVKAKLYPISSEDMVTHIVAKSNDANWIQKFIKASTREISFFKDFLFGINKAKVDALSMSRRGSSSKMWKVLERRAKKSRWNRLMANSSTDSTAITTIMISQNEVDFIKKEFQIDITEVRNTRVLIDQFNLLGICIVDESLEIAKFMWDTGEDLWETVSFGNLERESNDNTYKKVVNLMTKMR